MQEQLPSGFTRYQIFIIALLAFIQFTVVLDFMVLQPLSVILLKELSISTEQFGLVVSAYAFSAGAAGLLAAGFADRFDRKKMLLFFYTGFVGGTLLCGIAPDYHFLLAARIVTGIFGGVMSSISYAIITDLFPLQVRGRVMGFVQLAFAMSQIAGIPVGLYLANNYDWRAPFLAIVAISAIIGIFIFFYLKPITEHLKIQTRQNALRKLWDIVMVPQYRRAFAATTLLATGGFMLMPFGSAYGVHNLGISKEDELPLLYLITGCCMLIFSPMIGALSDKVGKYKMFVIGSIITGIMTYIYCNLGVTPFWIIAILNVILFVGITGRMISSSALMTAVPEPKDRGAFMGVNSSVQQIAGGIGSFIAGLIVSETSTGYIENYPLLGNVVIVALVITVFPMYIVNNYVAKKHSRELVSE
jgi:predicted MFS family arabinose efflux permease